ncbi:hypothetical protein FRC17_010133 [Serendipita sp. 399]|nr:hypothetical protein FRC17_010133 [Serendipita sp. 399]
MLLSSHGTDQTSRYKKINKLGSILKIERPALLGIPSQHDCPFLHGNATLILEHASKGARVLKKEMNMDFEEDILNLKNNVTRREIVLVVLIAHEESGSNNEGAIVQTATD